MLACLGVIALAGAIGIGWSAYGWLAANLGRTYDPPVAKRFGELLDSERHRAFVGRDPELAAFDEVLVGRSPRRVLLVHGPGGIGKTTLLLELRTRARAVGCRRRP